MPKKYQVQKEKAIEILEAQYMKRKKMIIILVLVIVLILIIIL